MSDIDPILEAARGAAPKLPEGFEVKPHEHAPGTIAVAFIGERKIAMLTKAWSRPGRAGAASPWKAEFYTRGYRDRRFRTLDALFASPVWWEFDQ